MVGYIKKNLQEYNHIKSKQIQTCPYSLAPKQFETEVQAPLFPDTSPIYNEKGIQCIQQIVEKILYYARAIDMTILMALSAIATEQTKVTKTRMKKCTQLLDYLAYHSDAKD